MGIRYIPAALALIAGAWVLYTFPPETTPFYPRCAFHVLTGLQCPGCGITRALHHLLHGRVADAFVLNPLLFVFAIALACATAWPRVAKKPWFGWGSLAVITTWWIARNVI